MNNETKGMLLGFLGVCAFGFTLPITKIVVEHTNPFFITYGRSAFATIVAIVILVFFRSQIPTLKQCKTLIIIALGVVVGFPFLSSWAMQYVPASHGGVVLAVLPLTTSIVGVLVSNEKPSIWFWLVGIVGCMLVIAYALLQGAGALHLADFALLGAVLSAAIGYAFGAKLANELGGWQVICWALVISLPLTGVGTLYTLPDTLSTIPNSAYIGFIYLALFSQLFGFFAWYKGLAIGGIARVSQIQLLQPFITLLVSAILLSELIDKETVIFSLLVILSVWLSKKMPIERQPNNTQHINKRVVEQ